MIKMRVPEILRQMNPSRYRWPIAPFALLSFQKNKKNAADCGTLQPSTSANMSRPARIGVVIPTLGMNDCLDKALSSIAQQNYDVASIVVVDQSDEARIATICDAWSATLPVVYVHTHRGLSHARNTGIHHLAQNVDIVGFLDDDCTYAPNCFEEVVVGFHDSDAAAVSGRLISHESRIRFGNQAQRLDRRTVWTMAMEAAMFFRVDVIREVDGFSEQLGIGCPTPWQSGEGTDLLLRLMDIGYTANYRPTCEIYEHEVTPKTISDPATKSRIYGRGTGRVYRMHYSWPICLWQVVRPVLGCLVSLAFGKGALCSRRLQAALGRWEGITGWGVNRLAER